MSNISRSESNQIIKFDQSIEYHMKNIFLQKSFRIFLFCKTTLHKVKASVGGLSFSIIARPRLERAMKTNFITFQTVDPDICSILYFHKRVWD